MRKKDFVKDIIDETGIFKGDAMKIVDLIFDRIRENLLLGREVRISGVGRFKFRFRKARIMHNNLVGKRQRVPAKVKLRFSTFPTMQVDIDNNLLEEFDGK